MKLGKFKSFLLIGMLVLSLAVMQRQTAAQSPTPAYQTPFTTSITYQNVGNATANITLTVYTPTGAQATAAPTNLTLAANAGSSIYVGTLGLTSNFNGSAVMSSDQPIVATLVQVPDQTMAVKNRPLSNAFKSGSTEVLIATVLKNQFGYHSKFSVQNVGTSAATNVTIKFYRVGEGTPAHTITVPSLAPNAAYYVDAATVAALGASFNGSVVVNSNQPVVATSMELGTSSASTQEAVLGAYAFEGVNGGSKTVYMATALCNVFGGASSFYAVQNTGTTNASVTVTYAVGANGEPVKTDTATIAPGAKKSFAACDVESANYSGAATITSDQPVVAVGKITGGSTTAFVGESAGSAKLSLPYIRYSASRYDQNQRDRQRANIAIQNLGTALPAGAVQVKYYDKNGTLVGTHTLSAFAQGAKLNSNPTSTGAAAANEFGYYADGTFGGSAVIEGPAGSQLIAVVRINSFPASGRVGEDYNGIPVE